MKIFSTFIVSIREPKNWDEIVNDNFVCLMCVKLISNPTLPIFCFFSGHRPCRNSDWIKFVVESCWKKIASPMSMDTTASLLLKKQLQELMKSPDSGKHKPIWLKLKATATASWSFRFPLLPAWSIDFGLEKFNILPIRRILSWSRRW